MPKEEKDTVVFMTAYDIHKIEKHFFRIGKKLNKKELFSQFHIAGFSHNDTYVTSYAKCKYETEYDSLNQITSFRFDESFEKYNKINNKFADEMIATIYQQNSVKALLDNTLIKVDTCFNLEPFLVVISSKIYQVDSIAFIMNGSLIVNFELIDFETGVPLDSKSIYGRSHNYGIMQIEQIKYFDEENFQNDNRKIADIIFENVHGFLTKLANDKWEVGNYSYVHNIFVLSNKIENVSEYFQNVLGGKINDFSVQNLSSTDDFKLYSTEYLGVVTDVSSQSDESHILNDCLILESFKIFILLKMIMDYDIHHKLNEIIDNQIYAQHQLYPVHAPIITLNVIDNLKKTYTYLRYKQAIDFKLQTLNVYQDRKINKNGRLLNILLYILAMIGSAQTLQVLQTEFGIPFKISFWVVMGVFVIFGLIWLIREIKKR